MLDCKKTIGLRVDLDFGICVSRGVPHLLQVFRDHEIQGTFCVSMGPDGFGKNVNRIKSANYVKRLLSFNPIKITRRFGVSYLLKNIFRRSGHVGIEHPEQLRRIVEEGHEIGVHGYDHYWWAENVWKAGKHDINQEINTALDSLMHVVGDVPLMWASPNWRCSEYVLDLIDQKAFLYGSDCRGQEPFYPAKDGWRGVKIQLPVTMPCLHEVKQHLNTSDHDKIIQYMFDHLKEGYNVLCIHGYYEGVLEKMLFMKMLKEFKNSGYHFVPLRELHAGVNKCDVPHCCMDRGRVPGGRGDVSFQGQKV